MLTPADMAARHPVSTLEHPLRAAVLIDYQNVHVTGHHNHFGRDAATTPPLHASLIDPLRLAHRIIRVRNNVLLEQEVAPGTTRLRRAEVSQVHVFRGVPSRSQHPTINCLSRLQHTHWAEDPRVTVHGRPLHFVPGTDADGNVEPTRRVPKESGVDVECAVTAMQMAARDDIDLVVVVTHDSDLDPVVETLGTQARSGGTAVETAGWFTSEIHCPSKVTFPSAGMVWRTRLHAMLLPELVDHTDYMGAYRREFPDLAAASDPRRRHEEAA